MNRHIYKNWQDAIQRIDEDKKKIRRKNARLPIEEKLKIVEEMKQTGQWLRVNARKI